MWSIPRQTKTKILQNSCSGSLPVPFLTFSLISITTCLLILSTSGSGIIWVPNPNRIVGSIFHISATSGCVISFRIKSGCIRTGILTEPPKQTYTDNSYKEYLFDFHQNTKSFVNPFFGPQP